MNRELTNQLGELLSVVNNFRVVGQGVSGSLRRGYELNIDPNLIGGAGTSGGGPPPPTCPTLHSISATGVSICNTCLPSPGGTGSIIWSDISFNVSETSPFVITRSCPPPGVCMWQESSTPVARLVQYSEYTIPNDCTGTPNFESNETVDMVVGWISGIWYITALSSVHNSPSTTGAVFFNGSSSGMVISNTLTSGCVTPVTIDNPLLDMWEGDCTPHSGARVFDGVGFGGTITLT